MPTPPPAWALPAEIRAAGSIAARYQLAAGAAGSGALRFADPAQRADGLVHELGVRAGLGRGVEVGGFGLLGTGGEAGTEGSGGAWAQVGVGEDGPRGAARLGVHRELGGVPAATVWLVGELGAGPLVGTLNLELERRFTPDADPLDVVVPAALGVEVADGVRVGVEYVGQDLEDYVEDEEEEAEGGAVHVIAASGGAVLLDGALTVTGGPGWATSPLGSGPVGRASLMWSF